MSRGAADFRERLRRLRREQESSTQPAKDPEPERRVQSEDAEATPNSTPRARGHSREPLPLWMAAKLRSRARRAETKSAQRVGADSHSGPLQPASLAPLQDLQRRTNRFGSYSERITRFPIEHLHGAMRLNTVFSADATAFELFTGDDGLGSLNVRGTVYLDTETTGLSGGAGTYVFQVGLGRFRVEGAQSYFELWQGFMEGPEEEAALLQETAERVSDSGGVVSFFGKSFDRHRLEDKMRLHSISPPFESRPHLDLYHPLRRIFRGRFEDGKLRTLERELCGLDRPDDLPGAFAPAAWFDYIAGRAHRLEGVFKHNADDVLSLVTLASWLGQALHGNGGDLQAHMGDSPALPLARARAYGDRKEWAECAEEASLALRLSSREEDRIASRRFLARARSRTKDWPGALEEWLKITEHASWSFADQIEAAKCAERLNLYALAMECCNAAQRKGGPESAIRDLGSRRSRLEKALAQAEGGGRAGVSAHA